MKLEQYITEASDLFTRSESDKLAKCETTINNILTSIENKIAAMKKKTGDKSGSLDDLQKLREIHKSLEEAFVGLHKANMLIFK
jgi:hypothetical protein